MKYVNQYTIAGKQSAILMFQLTYNQLALFVYPRRGERDLTKYGSLAQLNQELIFNCHLIFKVGVNLEIKV